jgi:hypothetical protein
MLLPERLTTGPNWLVPAVIAMLLVPTTISYRIGWSRMNFAFGLSLSITTNCRHPVTRQFNCGAAKQA